MKSVRRLSDLVSIHIFLLLKRIWYQFFFQVFTSYSPVTPRRIWRSHSSTSYVDSFFRLDLPVLQCIPGRGGTLIPLSIASHPDTIFCHLAKNQLILLDWRCALGLHERINECISECCKLNLSPLPFVHSSALNRFPHFIASTLQWRQVRHNLIMPTFNGRETSALGGVQNTSIASPLEIHYHYHQQHHRVLIPLPLSQLSVSSSSFGEVHLLDSISDSSSLMTACP